MLQVDFLSYIFLRLGFSDEVAYQKTLSEQDRVLVYIPLDFNLLESNFRVCESLILQTQFDFDKITLPYKYFDFGSKSWVNVKLDFELFKSGVQLEVTTTSVEVKSPSGVLLECPTFALRDIFLPEYKTQND